MRSKIFEKMIPAEEAGDSDTDSITVMMFESSRGKWTAIGVEEKTLQANSLAMASLISVTQQLLTLCDNFGKMAMQQAARLDALARHVSVQESALKES